MGIGEIGSGSDIIFTTYFFLFVKFLYMLIFSLISWDCLCIVESFKIISYRLSQKTIFRLVDGFVRKSYVYPLKFESQLERGGQLKR